ncbi:MAG: hypothetical protein HWE35_21250 [Rhodobacteraceae bacterium]|nr:hypothetical protein [Paracoccaceae bacterium]
MTLPPQYKSDKWSIPAGERLEVARPGEFLVCLEASGPFKIAFDQSGTETDFEAGLSFKVPQGFQRIRIYNPNTAAISVRLGFGRGELRDARLVLDGAVKTEAVSPEVFSAPGPVSVGAGSVQQLAATDAERREIGIKNLSTSERVWVQHSASASATGFPLDPKEGLILTTSAEVHCFNPSAGSIDIATFETKGA